MEINEWNEMKWLYIGYIAQNDNINRDKNLLKVVYIYSNWYLIIIKRVQGCSQSDALKWVTCALFIFSLTARSAKSAQQKSIMHCVWSCGMQIRYAKRTPAAAPRCATHSHAATACSEFDVQRSQRLLFVYLFQSFRGSLRNNYIRPVL